ncbi:MAG: hypothetical protein AABX10_05455 [Nanoarchaeota archaeon]
MGSIIHSVGTSAGERSLTNNDLERILRASGQETNDEWIVQRTGIRNRMVSPNQDIGQLAVSASQGAIENLYLNIRPIQHIIVSTNTPRNAFPNIAGYVQDKLSFSHPSLIEDGASGVDIGAGCGGINFALMHADKLIEGRQFNTVLVIGVEKLSNVTNYADRSTAILFGDGASAYILGAGANEVGFVGHHSKGSGKDRNLIKCLDKPKVDLESALDILDNGAKPRMVVGSVLEMDGKRVFTYVINQWEELISKLKDLKFNPQGISYDEIFHIAPHLANLRCLENVDERYPGFLQKCRLVTDTDLANFHNTSTASQGRRVKQFVEEAEPGSYLLSFGYGAGLQSCANLYRKPFA